MAKNSKKNETAINIKYNFAPTMAEFDDAGFCNKEGFALIYCANPETHEYSHATYEFRNIGVGIPAHSSLLLPNPPDDKCAVVLNEDSWQYLPDYRGAAVYNTKTAAAEVVNYIGALKEDFTDKAPTSEFDEWDGEKWLFNAQKEQAFLTNEALIKKNNLLEQTENVIEDLIDLIESDLANEEDKALLKQWRGVRALLRRIKPEDAPNIDWPTLP